MSITILETEHNTWLINGKEVYKDLNDKYISKQPLSEEETEQFKKHVGYIPTEKKNKPTKKLFGLDCPKEQLKKVDDTITKLSKQLEILNSGKELFSREKLTLRNYYHKKLNQYNEMRNKIINNLPVTFKTVKPFKSQEAI